MNGAGQEERARSRGCLVVQFTADKRRSDAHRFYQALGFNATDEDFESRP